MIGKSISHYSIVGTLGKGGMGEVYLAKDGRLGRTVALKVLPAEVAQDPVRKKRFTLEARSASALKHPNVAHIYDVGEADGVSFLVMEHLEGETLAERLVQGAVTVSETMRIAAQIADALAEAHEHGITHRDIKPANIMITRRGEVKVLDFGLARLGIEGSLAGDAQLETIPETLLSGQEMTRAGQVVGTVPYMSPEQAKGLATDPRTDVWSVGVVLYEMLAGRRPFEGRTPKETLEKILEGNPVDVAERNPAASVPLAHVVRRCLEPDRDKRYRTARELHRELTALEPTPAPVEIPVSSPRDRGEDLSRIESVAVMPFDNRSKDEEADYLCEGLAESLIAALARLPDLRVVSRHASFALKDEPKDIRVLGDRLGVDALVLGDLRSRGERLQVNVELVGVPDGRRLWGDRYDRPLAEAADVEQEVVEQVAGQLKEALSSDEVADLVKREVDPQAYLLYLKGRSLLIGSATQMTSGAEYLRQAAEKDPNYALPHAALAESYLIQAYHSILDPSEARQKARAAARTAVELDPQLPEAHTAQGMVRFVLDWDWVGADEAFRKGIEMGPGRDVPHLEYADYLSAMNRMPEALRMVSRARELDPVSPNPTHLAAYILMLMGDYAGAIREFKGAIALHPDWVWGHIKLANAYSRSEDHEKALAEIKIAEAALEGGGTPLARSWVGRVYAAAGQTEVAEAIQKELQADSVDPLCRTYIPAARGDRESVLGCFETAERRRSSLCAYINQVAHLEPKLDLYREPRFQAVLKRMGLGS